MRYLLASSLLLAACSKPAGLPHRQSWELYSIQGEYSQFDCDGKQQETVEVDGRTFFLGCLETYSHD